MDQLMGEHRKMRQEEETIRKTLWELNHLRNNKTKNWSLIYTESTASHKELHEN